MKHPHNNTMANTVSPRKKTAIRLSGKLLSLTALALMTAGRANAQSTGVWSGSSVSTVTSSNVRVSDGDIWFHYDANHGIGWYGTGKLYAGEAIDGPVVYGWNGGVLGTTMGATLAGTPKPVLHWYGDGKVTIGSVPSRPADYKLYVEGGILTEKVRVAVKTTADWADYVFHKDYRLMPLAMLRKYVAANNHLPDVPSAVEVVEKGVDLQQMDAKLLQKIEELTLYVLQQQQEIEALKAAMTRAKRGKGK